jgi:hypothetical protein
MNKLDTIKSWWRSKTNISPVYKWGFLYKNDKICSYCEKRKVTIYHDVGGMGEGLYGMCYICHIRYMLTTSLLKFDGIYINLFRIIGMIKSFSIKKYSIYDLWRLWPDRKTYNTSIYSLDPRYMKEK